MTADSGWRAQVQDERRAPVQGTLCAAPIQTAFMARPTEVFQAARHQRFPAVWPGGVADSEGAIEIKKCVEVRFFAVTADATDDLLGK